MISGTRTNPRVGEGEKSPPLFTPARTICHPRTQTRRYATPISFLTFTHALSATFIMGTVPSPDHRGPPSGPNSSVDPSHLPAFPLPLPSLHSRFRAFGLSLTREPLFASLECVCSSHSTSPRGHGEPPWLAASTSAQLCKCDTTCGVSGPCLSRWYPIRCWLFDKGSCRSGVVRIGAISFISCLNFSNPPSKINSIK